MGDRNYGDSKRKSESVKSGKRRAFERGEHGGGPIPDGYAPLVQMSGGMPVLRRDGKPVILAVEDPTRSSVIRRIFELAAAGVVDANIARTLNRDGVRTQAGKAWTRRRVRDTLLNAFYAGQGRLASRQAGRGAPPRPAPGPRGPRRLRAHPGAPRGPRQGGREQPDAGTADQQPRPRGPRLLRPVRGQDAAAREHVPAQVGRREGPPVRVPASHGVGRPLRSGADQSGGRRRGVHRASRVLLRGLRLLDRGRHDAADGGSRRGRAEYQRGARRLAGVRGQEGTLADRYGEFLAARDDDQAQACAAALARRRGEAEQIEHRLAELEETLAALGAEEDAPVDAMLDFYNRLSEAVRGRLGRDEIADVNRGLREVLARVELDAGELSLGPFVQVLPVVKPEAVALLSAEDFPAGYREPIVLEGGATAIVPPLHRVLAGPEQKERSSHALR